MSARVSIPETATILRVSAATVRRLWKRGVLTRVDIGTRDVYFSREQVEQLDREGICNSNTLPETKKRASLRDRWDALTGKKGKDSSK